MLKEDMERCPGCMSPLGGEEPCRRCGYSADSSYDPKYLRPGTALLNGRYLVGMLVSQDGEGATYVGFDNKNNDRCWIREYYPTTLALRNPATGKVSPKEGYGAQYKALISDFVDVCNEVKRLAVTENVIPIRDVFPENYTCYAIYEHMKVITLEDYINRSGGKLPLRGALDMFLPLCSMVGVLHDHGYIHRGISPYTVYVDEQGTLYLWGLELSAARTANSELDAELFNGYSAPEQYATNGWQGTWTDIYALAALFYRMVSGFVPPKSTLVGEQRPIAPLDDLVMEIPKNISDAIADAMELQTEKRTQFTHIFTSSFVENEITNTAVYDTSRTKQYTRREEREEKDGSFKYAILALVFTVVVLLCGFLYMTNTLFPSMMENSKQSESSRVPEDIFSESEPDSSSSAPQTNDTKVPQFVGQTLSSVQNNSDYTDYFSFSIQHEYDSEFSEGVIFRQSPDENTPMPNRGTVILYVSKGPELVQMPDVVGLIWEDALKILELQELPCERVDRYTDAALPDTVVGTSPSPGTKFDPKKEPIVVYVVPPEPESSDKPEASSSSKSSKSSSSSKSSKSSSSSKG